MYKDVGGYKVRESLGKGVNEVIVCFSHVPAGTG